MSLHLISEKKLEYVKKLWRKSPLAEWRRNLLRKRMMREYCRKIDARKPIFYDEGILCRYMDRSEYYSQFGQDAFLDKVVFHGKRDGFFIDIGANHPEKLNNTLYFESLGWDGMAFEPQVWLCELWKDRKVECHNLALGDEEGMLEFAEYAGENGEGTLSGAASVLGKAAGKKYTVRQRRLGDVLKEVGGGRMVDFVSIDVEGYEMNVLRGIDFEAVDIRCFLIENNKEKGELPDMGIRKFMDEKGYDFIGRIVCDDIFIKKEK